MEKYSIKKTLALVILLALGIASGRTFLPNNTVNTVQTVFVPARLSAQQVILDAGHGGEDGGAVSVTGVPESRINLEITMKLDLLLGLYGISPLLLRDTDISLHDESAKTIREKKVSDLHYRVSKVQETENAILVSIHQNTFPDPSLHGCQVFFREEGESQRLAEVVQTSVREHLDTENHRKAAKIPSSVYLMKHITCPAILVECGFLSNTEEEAKLCTKEYQIQMASCIAAGVLQAMAIHASP